MEGLEAITNMLALMQNGQSNVSDAFAELAAGHDQDRQILEDREFQRKEGSKNRMAGLLDTTVKSSMPFAMEDAIARNAARNKSNQD